MLAPFSTEPNKSADSITPAIYHNCFLFIILTNDQSQVHFQLRLPTWMAQARSLTLLINQRGKLLTLSVMSQFIVFLDKRIFLRVHTHSVVLSLVATYKY